ncbi:MAG: hypothetical protein KJ626_05740 [Verrucomicrobia bacterium]|nr:hypothetical protein [Verrucomicrobiota bacterium]
MKKAITYLFLLALPALLGGCYLEGHASSDGSSHVVVGADCVDCDDFYYDDVVRYDYIVQVHVYDPWGAPVYGAWIDLIVSDTPEIATEGPTDPDGFISFVVHTQPDTVITAIATDAYWGENFDTEVTDWDNSLVTLQIHF